MSSVFNRIKKFNSNREPSFVQVKFKLLSENAFRFFRGTCHLFYEDLYKNIPWRDKTKCWICGDLHLENFGSYKGDNGVVYFDMNDFDEAILAPATWEITRMATSIYIGAQLLKLDKPVADTLCNTYLDAYFKILATGKSQVVEKETASGLLKELLQNVKKRKEHLFIEERTIKTGTSRTLKAVEGKISFIKAKEKKLLFNAVKDLCKHDEILKRYKPVDIAHRIAGTGSVGLDRYALLVQGRISLNFHLLDVKQAMPSSLRLYTPFKQPAWPNQAERIITLQKRIQHVSPALLHTVKLGEKYFVLKELQPTQDRMDLALCKGNLEKLQSIITTMASITASAQLRATGRQGSSTADELIEFAKDAKRWKRKVQKYAGDYALTVAAQYKEYCDEYADSLKAGNKKSRLKIKLH